MMKRLVWLFGVSALAFGGCSDDVTRIGDDPGGSSGHVSSGGTGATTGAGGLSGVWSIQASSPFAGTLATGTLVLGAGQLALSIDGASLVYSDGGSVQSLHFVNPKRSQDVELSVTRVGADLSSGELPLALGGQWSVSHPFEPGSCSATLAADAFGAGCVDVGGEPAGFPSLNATLSAGRSQVLPSILGDLGGAWQVQSNGGANGTCSVTFSEARVDATCAATQSALDGTLSFELAADSGSGATDRGLELSAHRLSAAMAVAPEPLPPSLGEIALVLAGDDEAVELLERAEARAGSLGLDVDDELDRDLASWARAATPKLVAARSWSRGAAFVADRAGVLQSLDSRRVLSRLRRQAAAPASAIALVIGPEPSAAEARRWRDRARRLERAARRSGRTLPSWVALLAGAPERSFTPPLSLDEDHVAVVPRLDASTEELAAEIERALGPDARWVRRPAAR
jgi:hypothetical protein